MDADELADLAPELSNDVLQELMSSLDTQERERLQSALSYEEDRSVCVQRTEFYL